MASKSTVRNFAQFTALMSAGLAAVSQVRAEGNASEQHDSLEEITITAERRAEDVQQVSIAATVLNGDQLENKAVAQLADLQNASPSLSITPAGPTQSVNIRGVGIASTSAAVSNGVATYIDGLFQTPIVGTNAFYDIANIEVLRGPQGTLVGSNSTGGAIFITTESPKLNASGGYAQAEVGNYNAYSAQGAVNIPATDTLAMRLAGYYSKRDSFYESIGSAHTNAGSEDEASARAGLLWKPGAFQVLAKFEATDRDNGGFAFHPIPGTLYAPAATWGPFQLAYDSPTELHERSTQSDIELRYEFANGIALRSLSGYQDKNFHYLIDNDATMVVPPSTTDQWVRERIWTEEVNVISPTTGRYNWIAGGYLQRNKIDVDLANGAFPVFINTNPEKTTTGIFAQLNVNLSERVELQTGVRYSTFRADGPGYVRLFARSGPQSVQVADLAGSHSDGRPTGKISLNYKLDSNNLLYVFLARGYKPGGYNSAISQFDPETVTDYEAGWKSTMAGGHLRTQLGGFYYRYQNFQFGVVDTSSGQSGVQNLPTAKIQGFEAQMQGQFGALGLDAGVAYVDSKLPGTGAFVNALLLPPPGAGQLGPQCSGGATPPACFDYGPYTQTAPSGPNLFSPKWSLNGGVEYRFDLGGGYSLTPRLNYSYLGSQYANLSYSPVTDYIAARGLLSALLTLNHKQWRIQAYGENLGNKLYVTGQSGSNEFIGAPRQFGVRVSTKF